MNLKIALPLAALSAAALTAAAPMAAAMSPAQPEAARNKQCFWTRQISNFASDDPHTVNLRVGAKDVYQLEMFGRCHDVDWAQKIAVRSRGSSFICTGVDAEIIAPSSIGPQRCPVRTVRKLSPDEVEALPKRSRP